jgi:hypothetical protein
VHAREHDSVARESWSDLIGGIFIDATKLLAEELQLAKLKLKADLQRAKVSFVLLILGGLTAAMGLLMILVMAAFILNVTLNLPLWACFGIIGAGMLFLGGVLLMAAKLKSAQVDFIPQRSTEAVKEDFQWIRSSIKTSKIANEPGRH